MQQRFDCATLALPCAAGNGMHCCCSHGYAPASLTADANLAAAPEAASGTFWLISESPADTISIYQQSESWICTEAIHSRSLSMQPCLDASYESLMPQTAQAVSATLLTTS